MSTVLQLGMGSFSRCLLILLLFSLPAFAELNSRPLAEAIVASLPDYPEGEESAGKKAMAEADVVVAVPIKAFPLIAESGLLNQFQTGSTGGSPNLGKRQKVDKQMSGLPFFEVAPASLHPKSGFLTPKGAESYDGFRDQYGEVLLKFKKRAWSRGTFTSGDSLEGYPAYPLSSAGKYLSLVSGLKFDPLEYMEAQLWGDLSLSDVEVVYLPEDVYKSHRKEIQPIQKQFGFEVKTYKKDSAFTTFKMSRIKPALKPSPSNESENMNDSVLSPGLQKLQEQEQEFLEKNFLDKQTPDSVKDVLAMELSRTSVKKPAIKKALAARTRVTKCKKQFSALK